MRLILLSFVLATHQCRRMVAHAEIRSFPMKYSTKLLDEEGNCSYSSDELLGYGKEGRDELHGYGRDKSLQEPAEKYLIDPFWNHVKTEKNYGQRATKEVLSSRHNQPNGVARLRRVPDKAADKHVERPTRSLGPTRPIDRTKSLSYSRTRSSEKEPKDIVPKHMPISRISGVGEESKTVATQGITVRTPPFSKPRLKTLSPTCRRSDSSLRWSRESLKADCQTSVIPDPGQL